MTVVVETLDVTMQMTDELRLFTQIGSKHDHTEAYLILGTTNLLQARTSTANIKGFLVTHRITARIPYRTVTFQTHTIRNGFTGCWVPTDALLETVVPENQRVIHVWREEGFRQKYDAAFVLLENSP